MRLGDDSRCQNSSLARSSRGNPGEAKLPKILTSLQLPSILTHSPLLIPFPFSGCARQYYIGKFETSKLLDLQVWASALSQCLFSLSPGFGTAITMSSHTKPGEDVYKAALITSAANTLFALIAGESAISNASSLVFVLPVP